MVASDPNILGKYKDQLIELVGHHKRMDDDRLALAIAFSDKPGGHNLYLMEVLVRPGHLGGGFIFQGVDDLRVTEMEPSRDFPLDSGDRFHLILTNPVELPHALAAQYPLAETFRRAVRSNRALILSATPEAALLVSKLHDGLWFENLDGAQHA